MDNSIIASIIGAVLGITATYIAAIVKFRQDLVAEYDKDLRAKRIPKYETLWQITSKFPKYARTDKVTREDIQLFSTALKDWYFSGGGMYLSDESRDAYFALQEQLSVQLQRMSLDAVSIVDEPVYEAIRSVGSQLRTALVRDVGTRKESAIDHMQS